MCGPRLHFRPPNLSFCTRDRGRISLGAIKKEANMCGPRVHLGHPYISNPATTTSVFASHDISIQHLCHVNHVVVQ